MNRWCVGRTIGLEWRKGRNYVKTKQGRIHGYPIRVRVSRSSAGEGHQSIWAGAVGSKSSKMPKKSKGDRPTNGPTDRHSGV